MYQIVDRIVIGVTGLVYLFTTEYYIGNNCIYYLNLRECIFIGIELLQSRYYRQKGKSSLQN